MSDTRQTSEQTMAAALAPFGWTCGPEFWQRYHSDPWVFNLANAVERLSRRDVSDIATAAGFAPNDADRVEITRQVTEVEQERRQRMEETAATIGEAVAIVRDFAASAVEFDDNRVGWLSVQIDRPVWGRCQRWVSAHPAPAEETTSG